MLKTPPSTLIALFTRKMHCITHHLRIPPRQLLFFSLATFLPSHSIELYALEKWPAHHVEHLQDPVGHVQVKELAAPALKLQIAEELTLQAAENQCLSHSLELQASYLQERAARYRYLQSTSAFLPTLNYLEELGVQKNQRTFARKVSLNQLLYSNTALVTKALKKVDWTTAILQRVSLENQLLFSVRSKYFTCVLARVNRQVTQDQIALLRKSLQQEQKRLELGASTTFDVNQAKVALAGALSSYYESVRNEKTAIDQLASVLGTRVGSEQLPNVRDREIDIERIPFLKDKIALLDSGLDPLLERNFKGSEQFEWGAPNCQNLMDREQIREFKRQALLYKPDLRIARLGLASGLLNVKLQRSTYYPPIGSEH